MEVLWQAEGLEEICVCACVVPSKAVGCGRRWAEFYLAASRGDCIHWPGSGAFRPASGTLTHRVWPWLTWNYDPLQPFAFCSHTTEHQLLTVNQVNPSPPLTLPTVVCPPSAIPFSICLSVIPYQVQTGWYCSTKVCPPRTNSLDGVWGLCGRWSSVGGRAGCVNKHLYGATWRYQGKYTGGPPVGWGWHRCVELVDQSPLYLLPVPRHIELARKKVIHTHSYWSMWVMLTFYALTDQTEERNETSFTFIDFHWCYIMGPCMA